LIIKASKEYIKKIIEIELDALGHTLGESFFELEIDNPFSRIYLYEKDNEFVGYISLRIVDEKAELLNFGVKKLYQNQGIGQKIFSFVLEDLKKEKVKTLILEVRSKNHTAIHFYQKFGGKKIHELKNYYGDDDAHIYLLEVK